jgi:hypothetical protein
LQLLTKHMNHQESNYMTNTYTLGSNYREKSGSTAFPRLRVTPAEPVVRD